MPMKKGTGRKTISENIKEFHKGNTYAKTKAKHGKAIADKQAVAASFAEARRSAGSKKKSSRTSSKRRTSTDNEFHRSV